MVTFVSGSIFTVTFAVIGFDAREREIDEKLDRIIQHLESTKPPITNTNNVEINERPSRQEILVELAKRYKLEHPQEAKK